MTGVNELERNYRAAFLRYLSSQDEAALHVGYQIGRAAVGDGLSILELAHVHHQVFLEVLTETPPDNTNTCRLANNPSRVRVVAARSSATRVSSRSSKPHATSAAAASAGSPPARSTVIATAR